MITKAESIAFERDFRKRYLPLAKKLKKVEADIYRLMINSMSNAEMSTAYWRAQGIKLKWTKKDYFCALNFNEKYSNRSIVELARTDSATISDEQNEKI